MTHDPFTYLNRIPVVGGRFAKIGQIYELNSYACAAEWEIWVSAFFYELPTLLWAFVQPDPMDYLTDRFYIGKRGKRRYRFKGRFWEQGPQLQPGTRPARLFKGIQNYERLGWYLLIADATLDFGLRWTSTVYRWEGCKNPFAPFCIMNGVAGDVVTHLAYQTVRTTLVDQQIISGGGGIIEVPAGVSASVFANLSWTPYPGFPNASLKEARVVDRLSGASFPLPMGRNADNSGGFASGRAFLDRPSVGGRSYRFEAIAQNGYISVTSARFSAYGSQQEVLAPFAGAW